MWLLYFPGNFILMADNSILFVEGVILISLNQIISLNEVFFC